VIPDTRAPDVAGEVEGFKTLRARWAELPYGWGVERPRRDMDVTPELLSPWNGQPWPADGWTVAVCHQGRMHAVRRTTPLRVMAEPEAAAEPAFMEWEPCSHAEVGIPVPQPDCSCGIYAVETMGQAVSYLEPGRVMVRVAGAGRVIPGTHGWRAEKARVTGIVNWPISYRVYEYDAPRDMYVYKDVDADRPTVEQLAQAYDVAHVAPPPAEVNRSGGMAYPAGEGHMVVYFTSGY
jgi:hypothetical protein